MSSARETLQKLARLAKDENASDGERTSARSAVARLLARYPELAGFRVEDEEDRTIIQDFRFKQWHEELLLIQIGDFLGLQSYGLRSVAANRPIKRVRLRGDARIVGLVAAIYKEQRKELTRDLQMLAWGWLGRTLPGQPRQKEAEGAQKQKELSAHELKMLQTGYNLGTPISNGLKELNQRNPVGELE